MLGNPIHIGEIMKNIIPDEIIKILKKLEGKRRQKEDILTETECVKLDTFLQTLESAILNPVDNKTVLVNPVPIAPDLSIKKEETMIDRIRHINSVSARVRDMEAPTTKEQVEEFESLDLEELDDHPVAKSIFQVADHEVEMVPDVISPSEEKIGPNPDLESEADPVPPEADNASSHE